MTARIALPLREPLRSVRVHRANRATGAAAAAPTDVATRLLGHREREARVTADREATLVAAKSVASTLVAALSTVDRTVATRLDEVAALATEIGLAVAREIVGAALDAGLVDPSPFVARCLRDCVQDGGTTRVVVHLAPADLSTVLTGIEADADLAASLSRVDFQADRRAARGTVRVETAAGRLAYDPHEVLARIASEVRKAMSP